MGSQIRIDALSLVIGAAEALPPDERSYPLTRLRRSGETVSRMFQVAILENALLRVAVSRELGGRILSCFDKRAGLELLPASAELSEAGMRGVSLRSGLQVRLRRGEDRGNSMGPIFWQTEEPEDDDAEAAIRLYEIDAGTGFSLDWRFGLPPDRAEILLDVRVYNRTLVSQPYDPSVVAYLPGVGVRSVKGGVAAYGDRGLALWPGMEPMDSALYLDGELSLCRFAKGLDKFLGPRQMDTWSMRIQALSGLHSLDAMSQDIAASLTGGSIALQSIGPLPRQKVVIQTRAGQTLEAVVDLYAECPTVVEPPESAEAVGVIDEQRRERLNSDLEELEAWTAVVVECQPPAELPSGLSELALKRATFEPALKAQGFHHLGRLAMKRGDYEAAAGYFESALLFNAEDMLSWWGKAAAERLSGLELGERADLLNAHYLLPLDPILRAEAFLSQPQQASREPNPILSTLADLPESFVEVACQLIDYGMAFDAARWIDEALRHVDLPILHTLLAYCHLEFGGKEFEAAKEYEIARKSPEGPPYPWREIERAAIDRLEREFGGE